MGNQFTVGIVGPEDYIWEGAWAVEDVETSLVNEGLVPLVMDRPTTKLGKVEIEDRFIEKEIGALVVVNYEPGSKEIFTFDDHMTMVTEFAYASRVPIFTMKPIDTEQFRWLGGAEIMICKPSKLVRLIKNRLGEK